MEKSINDKWELMSYPNCSLSKTKNKRVFVEKLRHIDGSTFIGVKNIHDNILEDKTKLVHEERKGHYSFIGIGMKDESAFALYMALKDYFSKGKYQHTYNSK